MDTQLQPLQHQKRPIAKIYTEPKANTDRQSTHTHTHAGAHWHMLAHTHTHTKPRQTARQTGRQTDRCMHMSMNLYDASMWTPHNDQKWYRHRHRYRHRFMCKHKYRTSTAET